MDGEGEQLDELIRELVAARAYLAHMRRCPGDGPIHRGIQHPWNMSPPPVDGPESGEDGFDCSGLTTAAYASAGVDLPRTAHTQYHATTRVSEAELRPGDLVFYCNLNTKIHHVGLYIGNGQMIDAHTYGKPVGIRPIRYPGDNFAGGGRIVRSQH